MIRRAVLMVCFILLSVAPALGALRIDLPDNAMNGRAFFITVHTDEQNSVRVLWNKKVLSVDTTESGDGYVGIAMLALPRDFSEKTIQIVAEETTSGGVNTVSRTVSVEHKKYREQHLDVDRKYVELSKKNLDRHYAERATVRSMMESLSQKRTWDTDFLRPVPGGISSEFGVQRFFNGKPRKPHSGIDLRGKTGTPVKACADGVVRVAASHFFSGNSVYIDHGQGVVSMYFHLSKLLVREGETVTKGQVIGKVGATGRVTGPHLHFGLNVSGVAVDPLPLFTDKK